MLSRCEKSLCKHIVILQRLCAGAEVFSSQAKKQDQSAELGSTVILSPATAPLRGPSEMD